MVERVLLELAQFRALDQGFEIAHEAAADHVAFEGDVVAGREDGGMALAFRHLAAAKDADLDHRALGQLAEQLAAEVVHDVVERDDVGAAQEHSAEALLRLLGILRGCDDRTEPAGADHGEEVDQVALAGSGGIGAHQDHWRGRQ